MDKKMHEKTTHDEARRSAGFTLVEVLIAMALLVIITLGVLPLFGRAMINNASGADYLQANNHGRMQLEEYTQIPFDDARLLPGELVEFYGEGDLKQKGDEQWLAAEPADQPVTWTRTTRRRQFSLQALKDGKIEASEELDATADPIFVHLKEVQVQVSATRAEGGPLGVGKRVALRRLKAF